MAEQWGGGGEVYCRQGPNIYGRPFWCSRNTFASEIVAPVKAAPRPSPFAPPLGAKCSSVLIVRCVVGSILHDGPIELFLIPASAPRLE